MNEAEVDFVEREIADALERMEAGGRDPTRVGFLSPAAAVRLASRSYVPIFVKRLGTFARAYSEIEAAARAEGWSVISSRPNTAKAPGQFELEGGGVVMIPRGRWERDKKLR